MSLDSGIAMLRERLADGEVPEEMRDAAEELLTIYDRNQGNPMKFLAEAGDTMRAFFGDEDELVEDVQDAGYLTVEDHKV